MEISIEGGYSDGSCVIGSPPFKRVNVAGEEVLWEAGLFKYLGSAYWNHYGPVESVIAVLRMNGFEVIEVGK